MQNNIIVKYNGSYPCLCFGELTIIINENTYVFPNNCMFSGGYTSFNDEGTEEVGDGPWSINKWPEDFPEDLKEETLERINEEVPWGCCGGCI